jgi:hypothetical protein
MSTSAFEPSATLTLGSLMYELRLQIIDCSEQDLDVQNEPFGHQNGLCVLASANEAEHFRNACRRALLEGRENPPDLLDLTLHAYLLGA